MDGWLRDWVCRALREWHEFNDPASGLDYYTNIVTGESRWERPSAPVRACMHTHTRARAHTHTRARVAATATLPAC